MDHMDSLSQTPARLRGEEATEKATKRPEAMVGKGEVEGTIPMLCKTNPWAHAVVTGSHFLEEQSHAAAELCNYSTSSCHYVSYLQ